MDLIGRTLLGILDRADRQSPGTRALVLAAGLAVAWLPPVLLGGAANMPPHLLFVPIVLGGAFYGYRGAIAISVIAAILGGPLTPETLSPWTSQHLGVLIVRGCSFVVIGIVVAGLIGALRTAITAARVSALHDPLTGLANRHLLIEHLAQALARRRRHPSGLAVMLLDLDDFRSINESLGHAGGDAVLKAVAERLRRTLRGEDVLARAASTPPTRHDTVARVEGDRFVMVLEGLHGQDGAAGAARRVLESLGEPCEIRGERVHLGGTLGIVLLEPTSDEQPERLLQHAEAAMRSAKAAHEETRFFEPEMHHRQLERVALTRDLRNALRHGELHLLYQPQVELSSGRLVGVEALVRWQHPVRGPLAPDVFIPLAEATGIIVELDNWVLLTACAQLRAWSDAGLTFSVAVNVSARRLTSPGFVEEVERVLRETGALPERLEIEITETLAVADDEHAAAVLNGVRQMGVRASIDDFGMGQSALSRLHSFPLDGVKIDRSFIASLRPPPHHRGSIAAAMVALGESLDLAVVAEGIETRTQLGALRALDCRCGQGYLFSRPVPAAEIAELAGRPPWDPRPPRPDRSDDPLERLGRDIAA